MKLIVIGHDIGSPKIAQDFVSHYLDVIYLVRPLSLTTTDDLLDVFQVIENIQLSELVVIDSPSVPSELKLIHDYCDKNRPDVEIQVIY